MREQLLVQRLYAERSRAALSPLLNTHLSQLAGPAKRRRI